LYKIIYTRIFVKKFICRNISYLKIDFTVIGHEYDFKIIMIIFYQIFHGTAFIIFAVL